MQAVAFGKDDAVLATGGADKEIKIWDIATSGREGSFSNRSAAVTALHWTPGGTNLLAVAEDGSAVTITDIKRHSGEQSSAPGTERKLSAIGDVLYAVTATADAKTIFAGCHDGSVYVWEGAKAATKLDGK